MPTKSNCIRCQERTYEYSSGLATITIVWIFPAVIRGVWWIRSYCGSKWSVVLKYMCAYSLLIQRRQYPKYLDICEDDQLKFSTNDYSVSADHLNYYKSRQDLTTLHGLHTNVYQWTLAKFKPITLMKIDGSNHTCINRCLIPWESVVNWSSICTNANRSLIKGMQVSSPQRHAIPWYPGLAIRHQGPFRSRQDCRNQWEETLHTAINLAYRRIPCNVTGGSIIYVPKTLNISHLTLCPTD